MSGVGTSQRNDKVKVCCKLRKINGDYVVRNLEEICQEATGLDARQRDVVRRGRRARRPGAPLALAGVLRGPGGSRRGRGHLGGGGGVQEDASFAASP